MSAIEGSEFNFERSSAISYIHVSDEFPGYLGLGDYKTGTPRLVNLNRVLWEVVPEITEKSDGSFVDYGVKITDPVIIAVGTLDGLRKLQNLAGFVPVQKD